MRNFVWLVCFFCLSGVIWKPVSAKGAQEIFGGDCDATVASQAFIDAHNLKMKGDLGGALSLYSNEIVKEGSNAPAYLYNGKADVFYLLKDYKRALENYAMAFSKSPADHTFPLQMAYCWYKMGDFRKSRIDLQASQKINNFSPNTLCLEGLLNAKAGRSKQALTQLEASTAANNISYLTDEQKVEALKVIHQLKIGQGGT